MPAYFNNVTVLGNLTRDPEFKHGGEKGTAVVNTSVAVNDGWGDNEKTYFFDVTLWGRHAEFASEYLSKGSSVLVSGKLQQDTWEEENGAKRYKVYINASQIQGVGGRRKDEVQETKKEEAFDVF